MRFLRRASALGCTLVTLTATPAFAQAADPETVLKLACAARTEAHELTAERLAEALIVTSGRLPSDFAASSTPGRGNALTAAMEAVAVENTTIDPNLVVLRGISKLESYLFHDGALEGSPVTLERRPDRPQGWLYRPGTWIAMQCKMHDAAPSFPETIAGGIAEAPPIALREKPEELALGGDDRKQAGAMTLGVTRVWKTDADGRESTDTSFTVNGTIGVRITPPGTARGYLFARYMLDRTRTDPAPALPPGQKRNANDTNALELGALLDTEITGNEDRFKLMLTGQASTIFDFVDDSRRLKLRALLEPGWSADLGLCAFGHGKLLIGGLRARCGLQGDLEGNILLKRGTLEPGDYDDFLALGAIASYELFGPKSGTTQLLGGISYRYLPVISGRDRDIGRLEPISSSASGSAARRRRSISASAMSTGPIRCHWPTSGY